MNANMFSTDYLFYILGVVFLFIAILLEIYLAVPSNVHQKIGTYFQPLTVYCSSWKTVLQDYRSGKYYKPWKSSQKTIIVDSKKHIVELSDSPELSQRAVYADMFGFKHTMSGLDHNAHMVARSRLYGRLLQVNGPGNLSAMFPILQARIIDTFSKQLSLGKTEATGYKSVTIASTVREMAADLMSVIFFGENLSNKPAFAAALRRYPKDMVANMAAFQVTPSFLSTIVHYLLTNGGQAMRTILDQLESIMGGNKSTWDEQEDTKSLTIMDNMINISEDKREYWTSDVLAQSLLGIWFAGAHQPWMNLDFVVLELCSRPDNIQILRDEIGEFSELDYEKLERLPFLDSFIKETIRLNPLDTRAIRRKALKSFDFSDGPHVPAGSVACVSSFDLMHSESDYPKPYEFNGSRFVSCNSTMRGTKLTDISEKFPVWGYGSLACPGRFHASLVMKLSLAYLISNFDMRLVKENERLRWMWETFTMPYENTTVLFKPLN